MKPQKFNKQFETIYKLAVRLSEADEADALLVMLDGPTDWAKLQECASDEKIVVVADHEEELAGAQEAGLFTVVLDPRCAGFRETDVGPSGGGGG